MEFVVHGSLSRGAPLPEPTVNVLVCVTVAVRVVVVVKAVRVVVLLAATRDVVVELVQVNVMGAAKVEDNTSDAGAACEAAAASAAAVAAAAAAL